VDVWIVGKWDWEDLNGTLSLQLQMAHIIHLNPRWERATKIRILNVVSPSADMQTREEEASKFKLNKFCAEAHEMLVQLRKEVRVNCDIKVVLATGPELRARCAAGLREQDTQFEGTVNTPTVSRVGAPGRSFSLLDVNRSHTQAAQAASAADAAEIQAPLENDLSAFERQMSETNVLVREHSAQAKLVLLVLPPFPLATHAAGVADEPAAEYMSGVRSLLQGLPPTILLAAGKRQNVIPQEL
jgi:hypothetical protein